MAITTAMCSSFKQQLLEAQHDFRLSGGDTFKCALYTSSATLGAATTAYAGTNEVASGGGYTTGGATLTRIDPSLDSTTAITDFADVSWTTATFTANGALIYNTTPTDTYTNPAVCSLAFGGDKSVTSGTFTIVFPAAAAATAILQLA